MQITRAFIWWIWRFTVVYLSCLLQLSSKSQNWSLEMLDKNTAVYGEYHGKRAKFSSLYFTGFGAVGTQTLQHDKIPENTMPAASQLPRGYDLRRAASYREQSSKSLQFSLCGWPLCVQVSLGETVQIKQIYRLCNNAAFYARTELPSSMPNLERLLIHSDTEVYALNKILKRPTRDAYAYNQ